VWLTTTLTPVMVHGQQPKLTGNQLVGTKLNISCESIAAAVFFYCNKNDHLPYSELVIYF